MLEKYFQLLLSFLFQSIFIKNLTTIREFQDKNMRAVGYLYFAAVRQSQGLRSNSQLSLM